ncbi:hypothetical protein [Amycolatopsis sp. cmx-4-61]|uniref:hypothetical protein n=1 Tax=Amycolatopsis sp. cmx-4-61 TaxID=2790937 RepID=UPI00397D7C22
MAAEPELGEAVFDLAGAERQIAAHARAALIGEAELTAAGHRFLTVDHGDPEDDDQARRVDALSRAAWATRRVHSSRGGNDSRTFQITPATAPDQPGADDVVDQIEQQARTLNPGWWRIRRSAR